MEQLKIIQTSQELDQLNAYLDSIPLETPIAFDTETTGVEKSDLVIGFSLAADLDVAYYVILRGWKNGQLQEYPTLPGAKDTLNRLLNRALVMQNAPFDCSMVFNNFGIELMPYVHTDTLMLGHLLNENRSNGLKERGVELFGEEAKEEQLRMKESVLANGGSLTKTCYELYKAEPTLLAYYGAKDALLTLKVFYHDVPILFEEGLDKFFYEDETMPLLRGPTYDLNTVGLKVDAEALSKLRSTLEVEIQEDAAAMNAEILPQVRDKYPGTGKTNHFNIGSGQQLAWFLFVKLDQDFLELTKAGKDMCKALDIKLPYTAAARRDLVRFITENKGKVWQEEKWVYDHKIKGTKKSKAKKIEDVWKYLATGKETITHYAKKYKWAEKLLKFSKNNKLLKTYVLGIQEGMRYGVIRPNFLQAGTTSGRYACRKPNFQNLPRDDKRVKSCIVARPGKVFVGADYSQLEPRVFAYFSGDKRLLQCFSSGDDFYSVIGTEVFDKYDCSLKKDDENSFAKKYKHLRDVSKTIALAATYGALAPQLAKSTGKDINDTREILNNYFERFPGVKAFQLESHEKAKANGKVTNLFGRPRRLPEAAKFKKVYGNTSHEELPREARQVLNLGVNHRIQSTGASIMNRAMIAIWRTCKELALEDSRWKEVKIVLTVHDEAILEAPETIAEEVAAVLQYCMENTVTLPGVKLIAQPVIAKNLGDLK